MLILVNIKMVMPFVTLLYRIFEYAEKQNYNLKQLLLFN